VVEAALVDIKDVLGERLKDTWRFEMGARRGLTGVASGRSDGAVV